MRLFLEGSDVRADNLFLIGILKDKEFFVYIYQSYAIEQCGSDTAEAKMLLLEN